MLMFLDIVAALLAWGMAAAWLLAAVVRSFRPIGYYGQVAQTKLPDAGPTRGRHSDFEPPPA
jgi:hypothetical protein